MKAKKRLLIAGGGYADIPLIHAGKKLGYHVITSGNRPQELGHKFSDEYVPADYSDKEAILRLAKTLNVDALCACCNDFSALSCAYAAEKLGLPGHDSYEISKLIHHKDQYRRFAQENAIATPRAQAFDSKTSAENPIRDWTFPLIVKPVDLSGGKGMTKIDTPGSLGRAIDKALLQSKQDRFVIEEFIEGSRHGYSAFLHNGKVVFFFSDNEHYFNNPYLVSAASTPSIVSEDVEAKLCAQSERIASLLNLKTGIFHVQYILRDQEPVIIEITRRAPGDLYVRFVEHATGVDYASWIVRAAAGLDCDGLSQAKPKGFFTRHCVMSASKGRLKDVVFGAAIKGNVIDDLLWYKSGDVIDDELNQKFGIVFLRFDSMEEMLDKTERMQGLIRVITD